MSHKNTTWPFRCAASPVLLLGRMAANVANRGLSLTLRSWPTQRPKQSSTVKTRSHEGRGLVKAFGRSAILTYLIAIAAWAAVANAYGQSLIGSPGADWQSWTPSQGLNNNGAPYWDVAWGASGNYGGGNAEKNVGFCLTSTGDCQGIGSALFAPGAISFWGKPYNSSADSGGGRDNMVYFRGHRGLILHATLYLNSSANPTEINSFGWVEVSLDSNGLPVLGARHQLFQGTGVNQDQTPDPVGKVVTFTPTRYFAYYYEDVSEPLADGTRGCLTYTLFNFTEPRCLEVTGGQGDHDFAVFSNDANSSRPTYWVAGEDPVDCTNKDGDCNLSIVKVAPAGRSD